jgi:hypothetical protein
MEDWLTSGWTEDASGFEVDLCAWQMSAREWAVGFTG